MIIGFSCWLANFIITLQKYLINILAIIGAKYLIALIVVIALIYFFFLPRNKKKEIIVFSFITLPLIYVIAKIGGLIYYDPRPFISGHFIPLISHSPDNGFPSDHALLASAISMVVIFYNKKVGMALWLLTLLISFSRVYVGVHHAIDVIGSMVISLVAAPLVYYYILVTVLDFPFLKRFFSFLNMNK